MDECLSDINRAAVIVKFKKPFIGEACNGI